jgi:hypothetical protein
MNEVREFYGILYEEYGDVVAYEVVDAFFRVEFGCKATGVSDGVCGASGTGYRGEPDEDGRFLAGVLEELGFRVLSHWFVDLEVAVGSGASGVDDSFGYAFVVKMRYFFPEVEILQQCGTPRTCSQ